MIPSLVEGEIRRALIDYLATTFGLADDDVRDQLSEFMTDPATGIFRGPYLRVRTPFRPVTSDWVSPLGWLPDGFTPYVHQAAAFDRLTTIGGHQPKPTMVTTGTGSGKTECFLLPLLDHCARARDVGQRGIKAIILYPMNALASDQAGRMAALINNERRLSGLRAGLYVGENGSHSQMSKDSLIDDRYALRDDPPDILLTNYKMLDFLLLRREDKPLWATTGPDSLRYIVLDEFHTYDGAQGTDVAMLMRRLGATLGTAAPGAPLGLAAPVATSATLGSDPAALVDLREFAGKVFGVEFSEDSVIGETRQTIDEACSAVDPELPTPSPYTVANLDTHDDDALAAAFCRRADNEPMLSDPIELGERLLAHPLTRAVLTALGDQPRPLHQTAVEVAALTPGWSQVLEEAPEVIEEALTRYLALLSIARRPVGDTERPLFGIEAQLWIREVTRLLRAVQQEPEFSWLDTPGTAALSDLQETPEPAIPAITLPAVSCRRCGLSGWMATETEISGNLGMNPSTVYEASLRRSPALRVMLRAQEGDSDVKHLEPLSKKLLDTPAPGTVAVHVTPDEEHAVRMSCPACGEAKAVLFIGLAVASLASVSITTMFGSEKVNEEERKLLAFTDSVQDASHRASFFAGRTHRFNTRALMAGALVHAGEAGLSLAELGEQLFHDADSPQGRYGLVPPDLLRDIAMRSVWSEEADEAALKTLEHRVGFEVDLEFGLRSRVGRTLEQSGASAAWVDLDESAALLVEEALADVLGEVPSSAIEGADAYLLGICDRLRGNGALHNPLLEPFVAEGGSQWFIWGGRPNGLPPFTHEQSRPTFVSTASKSEFDSLAAKSSPATWWADWATRSLGINPAFAAEVNLRVLATLAGATEVFIATTLSSGQTIYGLDRRFVRAIDIAEVSGVAEQSVVRCDHCGGAATVPPRFIGNWTQVPCRRYRCIGRYHSQDPVDSGYYRRFYRKGTTTRVVTGEHTGLLNRRDREALETAFKDGTAPDSPNVLTATPTLEMGIDIGDLSAVMLTSVPRNPASYIQRVGRAGRATGNSLVTTFVRSDTHGLYYLAEPEAMLAGSVRPPNCYLEARETLNRQYVAYLMDRMASGTIAANPLPNKVGELMRTAFMEGGLFQVLKDTSIGDSTHVETFLGLFGTLLGQDAADRLREFALGGIEPHLKDVTDSWFAQLRELGLRRDRLAASIDKLETAEHRDQDDEEELRSLRGQRSAVIQLLREHRDEYPLSALERTGILPNYSLTGDVVTLTANLWSKPREEGGEFESQTLEFARPGIRAITEFAPGNTFFASGHKHVIDALEIGAAQEPLYEEWRICPECAYADIEPAGQSPTSCPRCSGQRIADVGARHKVLRLRHAFATAPEEAARVFDESDNRTKERYELVSLVDPDPTEIRDAWLIDDRSFGAEFAGRVRLRTFNLGLLGKPGEQVELGGHEHTAPRFTVCRHCGAVRDVREKPNSSTGSKSHLLHQGWCKVRSGSQPASWDPLILVHELTTEAIRLLVPVSMYEVDERLASFKGALLLGIRETLGGNPEHLRITTADSPNRSGQGRRRFLVLYDQVPGGTGYLSPLADPESIKAILEAAREVIAHCPCRNEGRPACHRCLLGVVGRNEYDLVRRDLARELLDSMLEEPFEPQKVSTIGNASIAGVEESELERRFKVALRQWADGAQNADVTLTKVPGRGRYEAFELTIGFFGQVVRYRISEQEGLSNLGSTLPDFLIKRMDSTSADIAVYLDGFEYHASQTNNNIASDSQKRSAVRANGQLVWNLTWEDVKQFHTAVAAEPPTEPPDRLLMTAAARIEAKNVHQKIPGPIDIDALQQNPMALLLDYLVRPDREAWKRAVLSAIAGMAVVGGTSSLDADGLQAQLDAALAGTWVQLPTAAGAEVALGSRVVTPGQLPLAMFLDTAQPAKENWTVLAVLDDSPGAIRSSQHLARWADWLPWANLLQFLGLPESQQAGIASGSSQAQELQWGDLWLRSRTARSTATRTIDLSESELEQLDLIDNLQVGELVRQALERGASLLVAGHEVDGLPLEAAWPHKKVAVLLPGSEAVSGWDARPVEQWTIDELMAALEGEQ